MTKRNYSSFILLPGVMLALFSCCQTHTNPPDPLSLWNKTTQKQCILKFVAQVTDSTAQTYVKPSDRIAVFDFDGTIGCEKPSYMEVTVAMKQLCRLAQSNPALMNDSLYIAACSMDYNYITRDSIIYTALIQAFLGYDENVFIDSVSAITRHDSDPRFNVPYSRLYYAPMLELINYLKKNGFDVYIVSGSEQGFLRAYCEDNLRINRAHVIGSMDSLTFQKGFDSSSVFPRQNKYLSLYSYGKGKAELIYYHIGKQPIFAFGNTMGDYEMLDYTNSMGLPNLEMILVHDDSAEYVYHDTLLEQTAISHHWQTVSMKENFKKIFPSSK